MLFIWFFLLLSFVHFVIFLLLRHHFVDYINFSTIFPLVFLSQSYLCCSFLFTFLWDLTILLSLFELNTCSIFMVVFHLFRTFLCSRALPLVIVWGSMFTEFIFVLIYTGTFLIWTLYKFFHYCKESSWFLSWLVHWLRKCTLTVICLLSHFTSVLSLSRLSDLTFP